MWYVFFLKKKRKNNLVLIRCLFTYFVVFVGVLGCTGSVGQRFILLLSNHPYFTLHAIGASSRSAGKSYKTATRWKQSQALPSSAANLIVQECKSANFSDCDVVFSGPDAEVAGDIESEFLAAIRGT
jgi:aspartate-semialdehyde dehydrogenase